MSVVARKKEWLLCSTDKRLVLFKDDEIFLEWEAQPCKTYRCHIADDEMKVVGSRGNTITCDYINLKEGKIDRRERLLEVNFEITNFEVIFCLGWLLCCDNVSGALHMFDSMRGQYKGLLRLNSTQDDIYVCGNNRFQVFCNNFNYDTLTGQVCLNTYEIVKNEISLASSAALGSGFTEFCVVHDKRFTHFAVVSTCQYEKLLHLQLFLPNASVPFYEHAFLDGDVRFLGFLEPFSVLLASTVHEKLRLELFNILDGHVTNSIRVCPSNVMSFDRLSSNGDVISANFSPMTISSGPEVHILHAGNTNQETVHFTMAHSSCILYTWQPKNHGKLRPLRLPGSPIALTEGADSVVFVPERAPSLCCARLPRMDQPHDLASQGSNDTTIHETG